jgi:trigger factor
MNIVLNKKDSVNATISIDIAKADYTHEVENALKDFRKNVVIPGFRKGMAPASLLRQKYGKSLLLEEINKLISKNLYDYIQENKLGVLGEPLPSEEQAPLDFDKQEDFTFLFDLGLSPELNVRLTKKDKMPYYSIEVTEEMLNKQIENYQTNYATYEPEEAVEAKDLVKGRLIELDENGEPKKDGIDNADALLMPSYIKSEEQKSKFTAAKLQSILVFNPYAAYEGNEAELASFLKIKKEEVKNYTGDFSFEITEITRRKPAELNQELFDKIYGEGNVDSEEAFREKVKESFAQQLTPQSDYKFILDARKLLVKKAEGAVFPDAFLKRWMLASNSDRTPRSIEEDYPKVLEDLKFHLIKEQLIKDNEIKIEDEDLLECAKQVARSQFAQYGMPTIPDQLLENYVQEMLKKEETVRSLVDKVLETKLIQTLKEQVTLETQEITVEDFQKLLEEK